MKSPLKYSPLFLLAGLSIVLAGCSGTKGQRRFWRWRLRLWVRFWLRLRFWLWVRLPVLDLAPAERHSILVEPWSASKGPVLVIQDNGGDDLAISADGVFKVPYRSIELLCHRQDSANESSTDLQRHQRRRHRHRRSHQHPSALRASVHSWRYGLADLSDRV